MINYGWPVFSLSVFILFIIVLIISFMERKKLINMLMSKNYSEYAAFELENKILNSPKKKEQDEMTQL